jgi:hypothetical protein
VGTTSRTLCASRQPRSGNLSSSVTKMTCQHYQIIRSCRVATISWADFPQRDWAMRMTHQHLQVESDLVCHQASTAASVRLLASQYRKQTHSKGSVYSLQYMKRPGGYVQLHNDDAIDQGRQKYQQSEQYPLTALNTTLQQRSRTHIPLILTGTTTRPTLCHNKKMVHHFKKWQPSAEHTHVHYKWKAQQCPRPT